MPNATQEEINTGTNAMLQSTFYFHDDLDIDKDTKCLLKLGNNEVITLSTQSKSYGKYESTDRYKAQWNLMVGEHLDKIKEHGIIKTRLLRGSEKLDWEFSANNVKVMTAQVIDFNYSESVADDNADF